MGKSPSPAPKAAAMALLAAVAIPLASASAQQTVTFIIDGSEGANVTYTTQVDGITMTLNNPAGGFFGFSYGDDSADDFSGTGALNLSSSSNFDVTAFDVSFDSDVKVIGYNVSAVDPISETDLFGTLADPPQANSFSLTAGTQTSTNNDLSTVGDHSINGDFPLADGTTARFDTNDSIDNNTIVSLYSITVQVPEPTTWTFLGLGGLAALLLRRWRRARTAA